jgi:ribokinase
MTPEYLTSGGLRIDFVITADGQVHLREMGGNAIYSAVGARVWAADVGILSRIGANYPHEWLQRLENAGIRTEGILRVPGWQDMRTFYAYRDMDRREDTDPAGHFAELGLSLPQDLVGYVDSTPGQASEQYIAVSPRPEDIPLSFGSVKAAHLAPLELQAHRSLSAALGSSGIRLTLDPGERYMKPELYEDVLAILRHVDAFLPSEQEVRSLLGPIDFWSAACRFAETGLEAVVIKVGSRGAMVYDCLDRRRWLVPAFPTHVVDVTGAGDAFCGGFLVGFQETADAVLAACYGTVSASFVLEGFGALYATRFRRGEAEVRLSQVKAQVQPIA